MRSASSYEDYLSQHPKWHDGIERLRELVLVPGIVESIKWGAPSYSFQKHNVVAIGAFNNHLSLWFYQGSLLQDIDNHLYQAQEKTKAMRHLRYLKNEDIVDNIVREYLLESIENFKSGNIIKVERKVKPLVIPPELGAVLTEDEKLSFAFDRLTPSKRREYAEYVAEAKQDKTKVNRINKIKPMILAGQGLNDKYR